MCTKYGFHIRSEYSLDHTCHFQITSTLTTLWPEAGPYSLDSPNGMYDCLQVSCYLGISSWLCSIGRLLKLVLPDKLKQPVFRSNSHIKYVLFLCNIIKLFSSVSCWKSSLLLGSIQCALSPCVIVSKQRTQKMKDTSTKCLINIKLQLYVVEWELTHFLQLQTLRGYGFY